MTPVDDRDPGMDALLTRTLSEMQGQAGCVDAETMAAWVERTLPASSAVLVETHVSSCARCQAVAASLVRSAPEPTPVVSMWTRWRLQWLVPVAGTAVALAVYVASRPADQLASEPSPSAVETSSSLGASTEPTEAEPAAPPVAAPGQSATAESRVGAESERKADASPRLQERTRQDAAVAQAPREEAQAFSPQGQTADLSAEANRASASAPAAASPEPVPPAQATLAVGAGAARALSTAAPLEIRSAASAERWRVAPGGIVDYSVDSGATWRAATASVSAGIRAGASPSAGVCWLVGAGGAVWVSSNGTQFVRLPFPAGVDLAGVVAADARSATVTSSSGQMFRTDDQGVSWR